MICFWSIGCCTWFTTYIVYGHRALFVWFAMGCETGLPPSRIAECRVLLSVVNRNISTILASRVGFWRLRMNGFRSQCTRMQRWIFRTLK